MLTVMSLAILVCLGALLLGLIKPRWVLPGAQTPTRGRVMRFYLLVALALFISCVVVTGQEGKISTEGAPIEATVPIAPTVDRRPTWRAAMPEQEAKFVALMRDFAGRYERAENELKKSAVVKERERAIKMLLGERMKVSGWTGKLYKMTTTHDGDAAIVIQVDDDVWVETWNNPLSDVGDKTLIAHGSPLYEAIADLKEGASVRFSARLIRESSLTERGGAIEPEWLARFDAVSGL